VKSGFSHALRRYLVAGLLFWVIVWGLVWKLTPKPEDMR